MLPPGTDEGPEEPETESNAPSAEPVVVGKATDKDEEEKAPERILSGLLDLPAAQLASWALEQLGYLKTWGTAVERTEIYKLAHEIPEATPDERKAFASNFVVGLNEVPIDKRVQAVRLAMQAVDLAQRVGGQALLADPAEALRQLASLEGVQEGSGPPQPPPPGSEEQPSALVQNLLYLANQAKLSELPKHELEEIATQVKSEAVHLLDPQQLVDVVVELRPDERAQLTDTLVEVKVVPEEQKGLLQEAVQPGGYADKLAAVLRLMSKARRKVWILGLLPAAELLLAIVLGSLPCGTSLVGWLRGDSIIALAQVASVSFLHCTLAPAYRKFQSDPVGTLHRWRAASQESDLLSRFESTIPGVHADTWRMGGIGLFAFALLIVIGTVWLLVGALELMGTVAYGCSSAILFFCNLLIGLRLTMVATLLLFLTCRIHMAGAWPAWPPSSQSVPSL